MGNLLYSPDDDKEIYNKQNICLYDKIKQGLVSYAKSIYHQLYIESLCLSKLK